MNPDDEKIEEFEKLVESDSWIIKNPQGDTVLESKPKVKRNKCPGDMLFGVDIDNDIVCSVCGVYKQCADKYNSSYQRPQKYRGP